EAEVRRLVPDAVERHDGDEAACADRRQGEEEDQRRFRPAVGRRVRDDALFDLRRLALAPPEQQHDHRDEPIEHAPHVRSLLPITRHVPTRTTAATTHATIPSGTGPISPCDQPPRLSGCLSYWT